MMPSPTQAHETLPPEQQVLQQMEAELKARQSERDREALARGNNPLTPDFLENPMKAIGGGMWKGLFETKDFLFGEPAVQDKTDFRRTVEAEDRALRDISAGYSITSGISQMVIGLIGAGKLLKPIRGLQEVGKAGRAAFEVARGATASTIALDPHEERLSNLIQSYPALQNPVTEYLAADLTDSTAEGRFKNALESIGLDFALLSAVKAMKLFRAGREEDALAEIIKLEKARQANHEAFGLPGTNFKPDVEGLQQAAADAGAANRDAFGLDFGGGAQAGIAKADLNAPRTDAATAIEPRGESPAPQGTTTADNPAMPASGAPRVRGGEGEPISPVNSASLPAETPRPAAAQPREVTSEAAAAILKGTEADLQAIAKFGNREAAAEAGQVTARGDRLPWQKLRAPEEVRAFMTNAAAVLKGQMDAAQGGDILADAVVSAKVRDIAEYFGEAPDIVMGQLAEAGQSAATMVSRMEAAYLLANSMFQETYGTAFKIRNGLLDEWDGDAARAAEELRARLSASAELLASAKAISSNSGRALRRLRGGFQFKPEDLASIKEMDGGRLAALIHSTEGDPKRLAQLANPSFLRRAMDEAAFSLQNSLLWLYPTHVINLTSNALMLVGRPTEKLLGSFAVGRQAGSILREQAMKEYAYTATALADGWSNAVEAFLKGDSRLSPHNTEFFQTGSRIVHEPLPWKPVSGVWDIAENAWRSATYRNIVGLPTRALGAADEFFKTLRYRAVIQADAATRANAAGLTGAEFREFIKREMDKAIDPATGQALNRKALLEAQVTTFQQELLPGTAGASIQHLRSRHPVLTFVLPFVKTPVNVFRYGMKLTPGLNMLQREYRDALRGAHGAEAQAQAVGQMALGSLFTGLAAMLALEGKITGAGPTDANLRQQLAATGWQPYSYVLEGEDGERRYIPIGRLDPAGMIFSMVANLVDIMRLDPHGETSTVDPGIGALALAIARNVTDRTFLLNLNQAVQALADPEARGAKYLGSIAGNAVPLSSALIGANPDPYLREARGLIDGMMKNLPGFSETLPPTRDVFGEPVWRRIGITSRDEADEVEAEHNRIILETGSGIGKPDPAFHGVDLRDITLENGRNAYDRLQELAGMPPGAPSLKESLAKLIRSETYQNLADGDASVAGTRLNVLARMVAKYREAGRKALLREAPELRPLIAARQQAARGAYLENKARRSSSGPGARELLEALRGERGL